MLECQSAGRRSRAVTSDSSGNNSETVAGRAGASSLTREQQALVARHVGLVHVHLNSRVPTPDFPSREREYDDLFQEGCLGLLDAAVRYTRVRPPMSFAAYAIPRIRRAVHNAIFEAFATLRMPREMRWRGAADYMSGSDVLAKIDELGGGKRLNGEPTHSRGPDYREWERTRRGQPVEEEAVGHAIRRRFESAVARTLKEARARRWRRRNPSAIMARVAHERLLVCEETWRTALRQIARDAAVSSGRAAAYERKLLEGVAERLRHDPELRVLLRCRRGRSCVDGMDGIYEQAAVKSESESVAG